MNIEVPRIPDDATVPPKPPVNHANTFIAKYENSAKNYLSLFDEALRDNWENAYRMRLDPVIMDPLRTRQRAVCSTSWHIEPDDEEDDIQKAAAANIEERIRRMPQLASFLLSLKEDIWFGRSGNQMLYKWSKLEDVWGINPIGNIPVNGDKLVFMYNGDVAIRVSASYQGETEVSDLGLIHRLTSEEREAFVIACFEPEDVDYRKPQMAGSIKGLGLRHRLYWWWSMKNQALRYLTDFMQWFGQGLTIYQFDANNPAAEAELVNRIQQYQGLPFLLFPRYHDGSPNWEPVVRIQADSSSARFLVDMIEYYDRIIRSMILGQTLTTSTGPTGMGSGVAEAHMVVSDQVVKYDCNTTQDYLTSDMVRIMYEYTYPGMPHGRWVFEVDATNIEQLQNSIEIYTELGGKVGAETIAKELGIPTVKPGETPLGKIDTLDPTAMGGTPTDTPIVNPAAAGVGQ